VSLALPSATRASHPFSVAPGQRPMLPVLQRLRERKFVQWALAYLAGAWVLLQVVGLLSDAYAWPPAVLRLTPVLLAIGFLGALVVAWYHGEKGQQRVSGPELVMMAALLVIAGSAVAFVSRRAGPAMPRNRPAPVANAAAAPVPSAGDKSIAVIPFANLSSDPENEYFSDGIADDVLTNLSKIGDLRVISRTSVMRYKKTDKSMRQIGQELGVAHVLEGSVRRAGNRVRISAQLIDTRTDEHLWAETYEREMKDIFAVQTDIAQEIADALQARLSPEEQQRIAAAPTGSLIAYDLYLRGRDASRRSPIRRGNIEEATSLLRQALVRDSTYARAQAELARAYDRYRIFAGKAWHDSAIAAARHAIRLDPGAPDGYAALAYAYGNEGQLRQAGEQARLAMARDPNDADALLVLSRAIYNTGHVDEALRWGKRAAALNPAEWVAYQQVGVAYRTLGMYPEAERWLRRGTQLDEGGGGCRFELAFLYLMEGRNADADAEIRAILAAAPDAPSTWASVGGLEMVRGNDAAALRFLERYAAAVAPGQPSLVSLAYLRWNAGERDRAETLLAEGEREARRWLREDDQGWRPYLRFAQIQMVRGDADGATRWAREAFDHGWRANPKAILLGRLTASAHGDPRFQRLLSDMGADLGRQRARVEREGW
jgi:TolB-like protein/Tfp pilus assembly protein PilF